MNKVLFDIPGSVIYFDMLPEDATERFKINGRLSVIVKFKSEHNPEPKHNVWESEGVICNLYNVQFCVMATQQKVNRQLTAGHTFPDISAGDGRIDPDSFQRSVMQRVQQGHQTCGFLLPRRAPGLLFICQSTAVNTSMML